jgi:hypothetical protein
MTDRKDLKRRVRERQAHTGESYMTALRQVLGQRKGAFPVVEMVDLTELAEPLGIKVRVKMAPELIDRVEAGAMLRQLRDALISTAKDRDLVVMRRTVLEGKRAPESLVLEPAAAMRFAARVRAGIGGVSDNGQMLALSIAGPRAPVLIVFVLWQMPSKYSERAPLLLALDDVYIDAQLLLAQELP